jgi:hypothetical protein
MPLSAFTSQAMTETVGLVKNNNDQKGLRAERLEFHDVISLSSYF